jgi:hypothetical protein
MQIRRGIIQAFSPTTYTASVLLFEATSYFLTGVPVTNTLDGTSGLAGALCAVLFFDEHNPQDAVIIAVFPNGSNGLPTPPPGRVVFVSAFQQLNAVSIPVSTPLTTTLTGGSSGVPDGALGVVYKALFSSAAAGANITLAPHGASNSSAYASIGNLPAASATLHGGGLLPVDANGQVTITANGGTCSVTLYTYGYIM